MTDAEFKDRVIALLEIIALGEEEKDCQHQNTIDMGCMGDTPGMKLHCTDCGVNFSRVAED